MKDFVVNKHQFYSAIDSRTETPYIRRLAPYDMTNYHWARKVPNMNHVFLWNIYREGQLIDKVSFDAVMNDQSELEAVALKLIQYDEKAKLRPCIDRT